MADSLKEPKLPIRLSLRATSSLATATRQSLPVLCLWVFSIVRLLNLVCVVSDRSGFRKKGGEGAPQAPPPARSLKESEQTALPCSASYFFHEGYKV